LPPVVEEPHTLLQSGGIEAADILRQQRFRLRHERFRDLNADAFRCGMKDLPRGCRIAGIRCRFELRQSGDERRRFRCLACTRWTQAFAGLHACGRRLDLRCWWRAGSNPLGHLYASMPIAEACNRHECDNGNQSNDGVSMRHSRKLQRPHAARVAVQTKATRPEQSDSSLR